MQASGSETISQRRRTQAASNFFYRQDLVVDPLEERERFAVMLRKTKRKEIIDAKRLKLTKSRPPKSNLTELKYALIR